MNTGGRYNPSTDNWVAASTTNAPQARTGHTAVWTGSEMIIWGGYNGSQQVNTGGRYCAVVPTPTPTATVTPTPTATATATATATGNGYTERNTNCNCDGIFYTYGDTYVDAETYSHTEASSEAGVAPVTLALVRSSASPRGH